MGPKDVIKQTLDMSDFILDKYLADLSDEDIRLRPIEGMNPIALQLGHLIAGERMFNELVRPGSSPPLPEGFKEAHDLKNKDLTNAGFLSKDKYVELLKAQRAATLATLEAVPESDLDDNRNGTLPSYLPTVGTALLMAGLHSMTHSGQFVAMRRALKKPIVF
jgi:DinB superfamily